MTRFTVLGAAGVVGSAVVRELLGAGDVEHVVIADLDEAAADRVAASCGTSRALPRRVDVGDPEAIFALLRDTDVVVNCTFYRYNLELTNLAIRAGVPLVDLGFRPDHTRQQLALDDAARAAGVLVIPGLGATPGLSNVLAAHGARALDEVHDIRIAYASIRPLALSPSLIDAALDNYSGPRPTYRAGSLVDVPAFGGEEEVDFLAPVGRRRVYCVPHSEPITLPAWVPGVRNVEIKGTYHPEVMDGLRAVTALGLHSADTVMVNGAAVAPRDVVRAVLLRSRTALSSESTAPLFALQVCVTGMADGWSLSRTFDVVHCTTSGEVTPLAAVTALPTAIAARMIARQQITGTGVRPPEAVIAPGPFLAELGRRGITIHEREERGRVLPVWS